ncbi:MAG: RNA 2',3'-cyclic phosphodiesterase [Candidatus Roizmanbacteria bacterium]|nr:MAG: RNA 2',3'-cyclic phosphodiesterase [Candidatus Roizmanbacteria bacterium]
MRLFLAIDLPAEIKQNLELQLQPLKKEYPYLTWVEPENFHISLLFLGEVEDKDEIVRRIEENVFDVRPVYLFSLSSSIFIQNKITLYVKFKRDKSLEKLVEKLRQEFNMPESVKFVPHLTVARYKVPSKQQYLLLKKKMENFSPDLEFGADTFTLFESIPSGKRLIYKNLHEFKLER